MSNLHNAMMTIPLDTATGRPVFGTASYQVLRVITWMYTVFAYTSGCKCLPLLASNTLLSATVQPSSNGTMVRCLQRQKGAWLRLTVPCFSRRLCLCAFPCIHCNLLLECCYRYIELLTRRGCIDFAGLVYLTRALLNVPSCPLQRPPLSAPSCLCLAPWRSAHRDKLGLPHRHRRRVGPAGRHHLT